MKEGMLQLIPPNNKDHKKLNSEQLCTNILDNLEEMDKILETYNLQGLHHDEMEHIDRFITGKV